MQFHWDPDTYLEMMRAEVPSYERVQTEVVEASRGTGIRHILELGTGTGETARRVLEAHPRARLTGIDSSQGMLARAREQLPADRAELRIQRLEGKLPPGPFDLAVSALAIHHLHGPEKADLFRRVHAVLQPRARFVLADCVEPEDPDDVVTPIDVGYDHPSPLAEQLDWLSQAGFVASVRWEHKDLAVIAADRQP